MNNASVAGYDGNRLISELDRHTGGALVFSMNGTEIRRGYHVTEIKHAQVSSLDCRRGTDEWHEVIIQLLDGMSLPTTKHMPVARFIDIVKPSLPVEVDHQLYFEFAPGNAGIQKATVDRVASDGDKITVYLQPLTPECKPMTRAIASCCSSSCCH